MPCCKKKRVFITGMYRNRVAQMLQLCVIKIDGYDNNYQLTGDQLNRDDPDADSHRPPAGLLSAYGLPALLRELAPFSESVQAIRRQCGGNRPTLRQAPAATG